MIEKTVTLYLLDRDENGNGDARGRIEYTVGNWEGVAYKIPWEQKERCNNSENTLGKRLRQSGLYCLLSKTKAKGKTTILVGAGDFKKGVLDCVKKDDSIDTDWMEAIIFVHASEKSFLEGAGLNYIEKKFCQLLKDGERTGRYKVLEPPPRKQSASSAIKTKEQKIVLDNFAEKAKRLMMIILWYFKNFPHNKADEVTGSDDANSQEQHEGEISPKNDGEDRLLLSMAYTPKGSRKKYRAQGIYIIDKEFILLKESEICPTETLKCPESIRNMRKGYKSKIKKGMLTSNLTFGSPSGAAKFVCGASLNGNTAWHATNGTHLGKLLRKKG